MRASYIKFGQTRLVELVTYTNGSIDIPAKQKWDKDLWAERSEDYYALMNDDFAKGVVRIIDRQDWIRSKKI